MQEKIVIKKLIVLGLAACLLAGCGFEGETIANTVIPVKSETVRTSMLSEAELDYEVLPAYPLISVDKSGYELNDKKTAIIVAEVLPAKYEIINEETNESVYTGYVKKVNDSTDDGKLTGQMDFSDLDLEGTFYIEADIVGCSDLFLVKKGIYQEHLKEAFAGLDGLRCEGCHSGNLSLENNPESLLDVSGGWHTGENGQKDVVDGCIAAMDLMLAYEYYGKSFKDDMGINESGNGKADILDEIIYETDWLLKMQNPKTGGVYTSVSLKKQQGDDKESLVVGGETTKATAYFCTAMARFSYIYGSVDRAYASKCMKAANQAWKCLEANKDIVGKDQMYRAAVEMYRATGYKVYSDIIIDFLKDNAGKPYDNRMLLDAAISYLDTPRYTDRDACNELMAAFMDKTEAHAGAASSARYLVEPGEKTIKELLRNACELVVVDYIISSSEYAKIEKNYLHFAGGRNDKSIVFLSFDNDPDAYAELIMVLGRLIK